MSTIIKGFFQGFEVIIKVQMNNTHLLLKPSLKNRAVYSQFKEQFEPLHPIGLSVLQSTP